MKKNGSAYSPLFIWAACIIPQLIWAAAGPVIKITQNYIPTIEFLFIRFLITCVVLLRTGRGTESGDDPNGRCALEMSGGRRKKMEVRAACTGDSRLPFGGTQAPVSRLASIRTRYPMD
jgi:hypothetical protein